jgi:hypothetical protein
MLTDVITLDVPSCSFDASSVVSFAAVWAFQSETVAGAAVATTAVPGTFTGSCVMFGCATGEGTDMELGDDGSLEPD